MLNILIGYIAGIGTCIFIFTVLAFFRAGIEKRVKIIETVLGNAGPRPTGAIFLPEDESEEIRREHIKRNAEKGGITTLSELRDDE